MRATTLLVKADPDGVVRLSVPGEPGHQYSVAVIMVDRTPPPTPTKTPEELGWPPGFFDVPDPDEVPAYRPPSRPVESLE